MRRSRRTQTSMRNIFLAVTAIALASIPCSGKPPARLAIRGPRRRTSPPKITSTAENRRCRPSRAGFQRNLAGLTGFSILQARFAGLPTRKINPRPSAAGRAGQFEDCLTDCALLSSANRPSPAQLRSGCGRLPSDYIAGFKFAFKINPDNESPAF